MIPASALLRHAVLEPRDKYPGLKPCHAAGIPFQTWGFHGDVAGWRENAKSVNWLVDQGMIYLNTRGLYPMPEGLDLAELNFEQEVSALDPENWPAISNCAAAMRILWPNADRYLYGAPFPPGAGGGFGRKYTDAFRAWCRANFEGVMAIGYVQANWNGGDWLPSVREMAISSAELASSFEMPWGWMGWARYDGPREPGEGKKSWRNQPLLIDADPDLSRTLGIQVEVAEEYGAREFYMWSPAEDEPELARAIATMWPASDDGDGDDDDTDVVPPGEDCKCPSCNRLRERVRALESGQRKQSGALARHERRLSALEASQRSLLQRVREWLGRGR